MRKVLVAIAKFAKISAAGKFHRRIPIGDRKQAPVESVTRNESWLIAACLVLGTAIVFSSFSNY